MTVRGTKRTAGAETANKVSSCPTNNKALSKADNNWRSEQEGHPRKLPMHIAWERAETCNSLHINSILHVPRDSKDSCSNTYVI